MASRIRRGIVGADLRRRRKKRETREAMQALQGLASELSLARAQLSQRVGGRDIQVRQIQGLWVAKTVGSHGHTFVGLGTTHLESLDELAKDVAAEEARRERLELLSRRVQYASRPQR